MAKKRANGEGSIRKRKDGRWEGRYTAGHDSETGKAIYKNVLGRTQAEVKEKLKAAIKETQALDQTKVGKYTVGEWMEVWFEDYAKLKVRPSSHQTYRGYIDNHIGPNIGDIPLEKLTSLDLQKLYKKLLTNGRVDRLEAKEQPKRAQRQDGAEHPSNSLLCVKVSAGAEDSPLQPGGVLCPAESGAPGNENSPGGTASILPAGSHGERCV